MGKKRELELLFEEWKERKIKLSTQKDASLETVFKNDFYKDGIIDENIWNSEDNPLKILFILKEVYEPNIKTMECDFLEKDDIKKGFQATSDTWRRVAYLSYMIHHSNETAATSNFSFNSMKDESLYRDTMSKIAIMNIKKCGGGESERSLKSKEKGYYWIHAKECADLIRRQINIIAPNIIICCHVFDSCKEHIFNSIKLLDDCGYYYDESPSNEPFKISVLKNGCIVFNNYHPKAWYRQASERQYCYPVVKYCREHLNIKTHP